MRKGEDTDVGGGGGGGTTSVSRVANYQHKQTKNRIGWEQAGRVLVSEVFCSVYAGIECQGGPRSIANRRDDPVLYTSG